MHGELPQFKRCCFCIPLRRGLIGWGYIRVIFDVILAVYLILIACFLYQLFRNLGELWPFLLTVTAIVIDMAFTILLIVGGHMKSAKIMRVLYIYGIVWLCLMVVLSTFTNGIQIYVMIYRSYSYGRVPPMYRIGNLLVSLSAEFIGIFVQVYLILLIRSEMTKLRRQALEIQFVNRAADGEAHCVRADQPAASFVTVQID